MTTPSTAPLLLTVCLGNICRSPTAEAALRAAAGTVGRDVAVHSAGTGSWHLGAPPDPRMAAAAAAAGLQLQGTAEQVTVAMLEAADLVFAMDAANHRELEAIATRAGISPRIHRFRRFDPLADGDLDVPDPYYGGVDGFADVVAICQRAAPVIIDQLDDLLAES